MGSLELSLQGTNALITSMSVILTDDRLLCQLFVLTAGDPLYPAAQSLGYSCAPSFSQSVTGHDGQH